MIEILGWLATGFTLGSFLLNDVRKLRLVNGIGSVLWIVYGVGVESLPTVIVNLSVLGIHCFWFLNPKKRSL